MKGAMVILLFVLFLTGCGGKKEPNCYSQYTGCSATATFIQKQSDPNYRNATPVPSK
jgi:PBP1b-binding outer membrane lipoprotein LpoB